MLSNVLCSIANEHSRESDQDCDQNHHHLYPPHQYSHYHLLHQVSLGRGRDHYGHYHQDCDHYHHHLYHHHQHFFIRFREAEEGIIGNFTFKFPPGWELCSSSVIVIVIDIVMSWGGMIDFSTCPSLYIDHHCLHYHCFHCHYQKVFTRNGQFYHLPTFSNVVANGQDGLWMTEFKGGVDSVMTIIKYIMIIIRSIMIIKKSIIRDFFPLNPSSWTHYHNHHGIFLSQSLLWWV